jgi:hypothetical protein
MAAADPDARMGRGDMRADTDTAMAKAAAGPDRSHMRAGMHAAITNAGARSHDRTGMTAGRDAVLAHACARADAADMGAGSNPAAADMGADTDAQHLDIGAHGIGRDRREKSKNDGGGEQFHRVILKGPMGEQAIIVKVPTRPGPLRAISPFRNL